MAQVILKHLEKRFGDVIAVSNLNLEIHDKEFMVLVGPSGCGKTTALRMIAGLEEITDGEVRIGDRVVNDVEPRSRDIAMVFQNYALYPHMNVYDNMAFGLKLRKVDKREIDKRVREAAQLLGIEDYLQRKPGALSGGQRQRVALGRAIVREPQVFLMDEPLSNLDAKLRIQTRAELTKLHRRLGITTIYVTHDQVEAMTMGDRIAVMRGGVLQQCDTPMNLYNYPANLFVAGFIGTPTMNFVNVTVKQEGQAYVLDAGSFRIPAPPYLKSEVLKTLLGTTVVLGIRPADIADISLQDVAVPQAHAPLCAEVDLVEAMGDVSTVYLKVGQQLLTATLDGRSLAKVGETIKLSVDLQRIHLFNSEEELALR